MVGSRDSAMRSALLRLRHVIETQHAIGDQLPNEKEIADSLDVSRGTVREALGVLATEGVVHRRWGVGTFVSAPPSTAAELNMSMIQSYRDRVQASGHKVTLQDASKELEICEGPAARALRLASGEKAWRVHRLFAVDGTPAARMIEYLPETLLGRPLDPDPMMSIDTDLFEMLDRHRPGCVARTVTDLEAVALEAGSAAALDQHVGSPVIRAVQVTYSPDDEPLAYGISLQRTDLVRVRVTR